MIIDKFLVSNFYFLGLLINWIKLPDSVMIAYNNLSLRIGIQTLAVKEKINYVFYGSKIVRKKLRNYCVKEKYCYFISDSLDLFNGKLTNIYR